MQARNSMSKSISTLLEGLNKYISEVDRIPPNLVLILTEYIVESSLEVPSDDLFDCLSNFCQALIDSALTAEYESEKKEEVYKRCKSARNLNKALLSSIAQDYMEYHITTIDSNFKGGSSPHLVERKGQVIFFKKNFLK